MNKLVAVMILVGLASTSLSYGRGWREAGVSHQGLSKIISAPFKLDGDVLTIEYNWENKNQINDFELVGPAPEETTVVLQLEPGSSLKHKVKFLNEFELEGQMALGSRKGEHISSSSGLSVQCSSYNAWFINLFTNDTNIATETFDPGYNTPTDQGKYFPISLKVDSGAVILVWDKVKIGGQFDGTFGNVILHGGSGGNKFRTVTISGVLDKEWAKEAIAAARR